MHTTDTPNATYGESPTDRRTRMEDLGAHQFEQRKKEFAESFWAPRHRYAGYRDS